MKLSCVKCQRFLHIKTNGVALEEGMPVGDEKVAEDGVGSAVQVSDDNQITSVQETRGVRMRYRDWVPYKLYMADLYECPRCGMQVAVPAQQPRTEHYMPNYIYLKEAYRGLGKLLPIVEDC